MATHPHILAWRIPWMEEPGRLQSMGSQSGAWLKQLSTHLVFLVFRTILWWSFKMWIFLIKSRLLDSFEKSRSCLNSGPAFLHGDNEPVLRQSCPHSPMCCKPPLPPSHTTDNSCDQPSSLLFPFVLCRYLSWPPWSSSTLSIYRWDIEAQR